MLNYLMMQPVKILFGQGAVKQLGELLESQEKKKPLIVTDRGIVETGIIGKITSGLEAKGIQYALYDKVLPDAPLTYVEKGFAFCQSQKCDAVIAVGGGSTIDTAKGINLLRFNAPPLLRFTDFSTPMNQCEGLISVPTTSGTGSELSDGIIVSDEQGKKRGILATKAMSEFAILDPELTLELPSHLTAMTGFDALAHVVECCTSNHSTMLVDQTCLNACKTIHDWLPIAVNDGSNIEARSHMMICAALGGWMLAHGRAHAGHSVGHILGSRFGIPHGLACAYALPHVLEQNAPVIPERTKMIGEVFGVTFRGDESVEQIGEKTAAAIIHFRDEVLHMKPAVEFSHDEANFSEVANEIVDEGFQIFNVRKMEEQDALGILKKIFK